MRVPKMVKNGLKSVLAYVGPSWVCLISVFWPVLKEQKPFYTNFGTSMRATLDSLVVLKKH